MTLGLAGCSESPSGSSDPRVIVYPPPLYAVTVPESVATGDSIALVVHLGAGGCIAPEPIRLESVGPRHVRATVRAREAVDAYCPANIDFASLVARMRLDDPGTWKIDIVGMDTASVVIEVGSVPLVRGIHRFAFEPRNGNASPSQVEVMYQTPEPVRVYVTVDSTGKGEFFLPCESGDERRRYLIVFGGFSYYRFDAFAEDCSQSMKTRVFR